MAAAGRRPDGLAAAIVAIALLFGGMPLTLGIAIHTSEAMFTLDVCHPAQSLGHSPVSLALPVPVASGTATFLPERGRYDVFRMLLRDRASEAPDPPPPRTLA